MLSEKVGEMGRTKIITIFVIVFAIITHCSLAQAQRDLSALVKRVVPSVVVINVFDKDGKLKGSGTGFFIKEDGALVTNYHVMAEGVRADVKLSSGEVLSIKGILSEDREADLILLDVAAKERSFPALKLTDKKIETGQPIFVVGSPFGLEGTVSDGIVSAIREIPRIGKFLQITAPISKGPSGSPVLNMQGEVVGVATSYLREGQNINFAISADLVIRLLSYQQSEFSKLLEAITKLKWSESAEGLFNFGISSFTNGDYEEALTFFKKSIQKRPNHVPTYLAIGSTSLLLGRYYEAIENFKYAILVKSVDANDYAFALTGLGEAYSHLELNYEAVDSFKKAIQTKPDGAVGHYAHLNLGIAYVRLGRYHEAIQHLKEAIRIEPDDVEAHFRLGLLYTVVRNRGMALDQYKILKELDVEKANTLFNLIYK